MNLMMGDHYSTETRLYHRLASYVQSDESRAAELEITVDQLYAQEL